MKIATLLAGAALVGSLTVWDAPLKAVNPHLSAAYAQSMSSPGTPTAQQKIDQLLALKGKPGSGDLLRRLYAKDLTPIGIQPGGAGMVVNLYSKNDNTTISLCTVFDVIVAAKRGKITQFPAAEVK
jgi:hypothetical protein